MTQRITQPWITLDRMVKNNRIVIEHAVKNRMKTPTNKIQLIQKPLKLQISTQIWILMREHSLTIGQDYQNLKNPSAGRKSRSKEAKVSLGLVVLLLMSTTLALVLKTPVKSRVSQAYPY
jgi:hypothetical protein